jgi:cold-inducible RNA-binding protein
VSAKVYVGNLNFSVTTEDLKTQFSQAGTVVDAVVIMDKYSGRSRGFGFVEMKDDKEAEKAIELFNGKEWQGRNLVVNVAREKTEEPAN